MMAVSFSHSPVFVGNIYSVEGSHVVLCGGAANICRRFHGLKLRILRSLNLLQHNRECRPVKDFGIIKNQDKDHLSNHLETTSTHAGHVSGEGLKINASSVSAASSLKSAPSLAQGHSLNFPIDDGRATSLSVAVIGATGELARGKIFPALFALYYNGFLPEDLAIFGYSRKNLTDEDLRSIIASNLSCRIDDHQNCGDKMDAFLSRTYYLDGGFDNREGMSKLNARMEQIEGGHEANRIFYLSVPQEALLDVASSVADNAQTYRGWNRIIIEKPFGFNAQSSQQITKNLLFKFEEKQLYRIDHLLGRNLIENLTVLRFSNLVFEPLWSRTYIRNVQVLLSEDLSVQTGRYFDGYGIIRDIVHSHIFQTIALLAMEPPISLDGEDIRNEKVKVLRSIRILDPSDVILGQYKAISGDKVDVNLNSLTPTFFAAAFFIDNARWDGVPFLIKTGRGLMKHRLEIRIQFHHVPGNLYRERIGHNIDLATNELILCDAPDEAILVKINNKIPGLGLQLDASELNLLYKDKYNVEVPDSYEHLLLDVIDGDNHLFMRSDELSAAWNILTPILHEIDNKNITPELYEVGGRGPVGAYYLWAKHGVRWADDS
ncbi:inactive glucose-6-phosphate 1-dehydrogenase 4, chloroplastic isoform X2 [Ricinus communis]|uniref:inactive glucose-6-phosphate 1-dehydrogenase 4, chloroplastic isoform X2 n=1 Tax=Ricinus communis TaxID=3988 RepID=UPI0007728D2D|nr:inactive glucose-6-phosphate 1-dehydrogenase 4, chloroplastic isoform X2 [Ricinus communis]|eukprot:XP_015570639.1 glucose-6-phosphate 1-dehydrogenase 4, chloroplastic isoform X2 [Ricinus communis]